MELYMPSGRSIFATSSTLEGDIDYSHVYKVGSVEIERNENREILLARIPHITFIALIYPEGEAWYS